MCALSEFLCLRGTTVEGCCCHHDVGSHLFLLHTAIVHMHSYARLTDGGTTGIEGTTKRKTVPVRRVDVVHARINSSTRIINEINQMKSNDSIDGFIITPITNQMICQPKSIPLPPQMLPHRKLIHILLSLS